GGGAFYESLVEGGDAESGVAGEDADDGEGEDQEVPGVEPGGDGDPEGATQASQGPGEQDPPAEDHELAAGEDGEDAAPDGGVFERSESAVGPPPVKRVTEGQGYDDQVDEHAMRRARVS